MRINLLDESTSNKIAAGEVVERPSSVVKELIENSIDAGSKNITIEIEEGGSSLIRIIDDGLGIHPEDIKKAFMPHATSKIKDATDIFSLTTLGFRGEALPSISSVSKVNIKTKVKEYDFGRELNIDGGVFSEIHECALNSGTIIEIRDIFYNIPARRKFLKSISREASLIGDITNRIALSNPEISFKLYNNNKKILTTYGNGKLKDVIRTIYGKSIAENILYFESAEDTLTVYGYIGKEEIARGSRNNQSIFVNGRYIKNKTLTASVENAFKSFSTVNKFPFFTLFIEVYPEFVDVNIHPSKGEVKFKDDRILYKKMFSLIHSTLKEDIFKDFVIPEEKQFELEEKVEEIKLNIDNNINNEKSYIHNKTSVSIPVDFKPIRSLDNTYDHTTVTNVKIDHSNDLNNSEGLNINLDNKDKISKFPPLRIIGQFNKTYIIGEYDEELYLIDQHAAHEKILFEKYLKEIEDGNIVIQPLLVPSVIELTTEDYSYFEENIDIFKTAGFTLEEFGDNSLAIKEVPYFLGKLDSKKLFLSIIDNLKSLGSGKTTEVKYNKIATMACKAAVKANDLLSTMEMEKLIDDLRYINEPFHCPHGRPTIIKFTAYDLDKKFRRIV